MEVDRNGLEVLGHDDCLALLATATLGRVAFSSHALPMVLPVTFALTDAGVVFRTVAGTKLEAAVSGAVVAFEADDVDPFAHSGWSVVVTGVARVVDDPSTLPPDALAAPHWVRTHRPDDDRWVVIAPDLVSGRRLP